MPWHVDPEKAIQLNLRNTAIDGEVIVRLPQGTLIDKLREDDVAPHWWRVRATLNGQSVEGYVHSGYLKSGAAGAVSRSVNVGIPEVHMDWRGSRRAEGRPGHRARPLDEPGMPKRSGSTGAQKMQSLIGVINYLDTENPAHLRYIAANGRTFCNIYAYDFCQRAGAYMPRVWWSPAALAEIAVGRTPPILYGNTVLELNANALHDWFIDFGAGFGWRREFDIDAMQRAVQEGDVGILVAKRVNVARSGHIVAVVPEHEGARAARDAAGTVTRPLQSQAGASNFRARTPSRRWWADATQFQSFGFWLHS